MTATDIPLQDLPLWMRRARRGVDWGVLLCMAFSLLAAWPFILQPGLPRTNASENYVFRAAEYAQAISEGHLYPRWSPNAFGGYGAPIPSFVAPGAAYIPALIQFFFTNDPVSAVRIVYVLSLLVAGAAVYAFVTRRAGAGAGLLASVLYVFSPYLALQAPHVLGDLPTCIGMALLPSLLWGVDRLLAHNRPLDVLWVAFTSAALALTHPQFALAAFGITLPYGFWFVLVHDRRAHWQLVLLAVTLGIGLAAFYWLPLLTEQGDILWRSSGEAPSLTLNFGALFAPLRPVDLNELVPTPQLTLGLSVTAFTVGGLVAAAHFRARAAFQWLFFAIGFMLLALALFVFPMQIWLLGPIILCLSVGGTSLLFWRARAPGLDIPLMLVAALGLSSTLWFAPRWAESFGDTSAAAQVQHEQLGYGVATLPYGALIPATISENVLPDQMLLSSYGADIVRKIAVQTGVQIGVLTHTTQSDRFQIEASAHATLQILTAYFPGWTATLNDNPLAVQRDPHTGLITVNIPGAASGELVISLGSTVVRTVSWFVSLGAFALTLFITSRRLSSSGEAYEELQLLSIRDSRLALLVIVAFGTLLLLFATPLSPFSLAARPGYTLDDSVGLRSRTEVGLEVLSYRLENRDLAAGDKLRLTLYWRTLRFLPANYRTQVSLVNIANGEAVFITPLHHPGGYPTQRWLTNRFVTDTYLLDLPLNLRPGSYALAVEVYNCTADCTPENRLTFFDQNGGAQGQSLVLPEALTVQVQ
jgi:hypothetical protein